MSHCHLYPGGRGAEFKDEFGIPGTPKHLAGFLKAAGFSQGVGLSPHEDPPDPKELARIGPGEDGLEWLLSHEEVGGAPDSAIIPGVALKPQDPGSLPRLKAAFDNGVRFIKLHTIVMRCDPVAAECAKFFDLAQDLGMAVIAHTGGGFWDWPVDRARAEVMAELGRRHPRLKIVLAHAGSFQGVDGFEASVRACEENPNVFLETTAVLIDLGVKKWLEALSRLGPSRIIYGNDYPFVTEDSVKKEVAILRSLSRNPADAELMLGGNVRKLLSSS